ncbi:DUF2914 domain-containing protein [Alteromonadaceae bacterium BrNp21-10]|nr:DUF2914 domain-containing protein [Alteromonadaceae bacterium BrNp21-10]
MIRFLAGLMLITSALTMAEPVVNRAQLTSNIIDKLPVDDLQNLMAVPAETIANVYFFTQVDGLAGQQIVHRWLYKQEPMAEVLLEIGGDNWRTHSSKKIRANWAGDWQVQVLHGDKLIHSYDFKVITTK